MRILVTRADDLAATTAERLRAQGHSVLIIPMTRIVATGAQVPRSSFAGVIATSARALQMINDDALPELTQLAFYAVGQKTARMAKERGFGNIVVAGGNSRSLSALIAARTRNALPLLYLAGLERKPQLEAVLSESGHSVVVVAVYRAVEIEALSKDQIAALTRDRIDAVLHYSRRSAEIFARLMKSAGLERVVMSSRHCCISADAAMPLRAMPGLDIRIAAEPAEASLLQQL